jgi:hypothetical protein
MPSVPPELKSEYEKYLQEMALSLFIKKSPGKRPSPVPQEQAYDRPNIFIVRKNVFHESTGFSY